MMLPFRPPALALLLLAMGGTLSPPIAIASLTPGDDAADTREFFGIARGLGARDVAIDQAILESFHILLVPGLVTDKTEEVGRFTKRVGLTPTPGFLASFYQQKEWMEKNGINFEFAPVNRSGGCDENGDIIAEAIERSSKPVILVTQSKGGVDVLHGLIRHPKVRKNVAGWVAYQPPHDGSILADLIQGRVSLRGPTNALLHLFSGSGLAVGDMSTPARTSYNLAHRFDILGITRAIPIVTLVTSEEPAKLTTYLFRNKSRSAFLGPFVNTIADRDYGLNDGIASMHGTCLENTACIYLTGIDHFASVMNTSPYKSLSETDRVTLFRTMLDMTIRRLK